MDMRRRYVYKLSVRLPSDQEVTAQTDETNTWRVTGDEDGRICRVAGVTCGIVHPHIRPTRTANN